MSENTKNSVRTHLHKPLDVIHGARRILRQRIVSPHEFTDVSVLGCIQHRQMVHVRVSEEVHQALQGLDLPIDGVVIVSKQLELHDELVVDGASALMLLHGDVERPSRDLPVAVLGFHYEVPARHVRF